MPSGVGIDLGSHSVRVVELSVSENAATVRRALSLDRTALAERGIDFSDRAQLAAHLREAMTAAGISARNVALGISGKDSIIRYTHVPPVPSWRLKIIMDYEVNEVAEKIGEKLCSDYRVLPVTRESDDDQAIIIGLAKEPVLDAILGDLGAQKIMVQKAVPSSIALYTAYAAFGKKPDLENPDDELVVVVDVGAENLDTAFLLNGNLAFARSTSFGGRNFSEALVRDLGIDLERAEAIKLRGGTLDPGGGGRREETVNPLRGAAAQLLSMIQSSLKFSRSQVGVKFPEPSRYVLLGGATRLPGLVSYLQVGLGKPVEVFHPSVTIGGGVAGAAAQELASAPGDFAVALGLAASMVREQGSELSLLPSRYRERRKFRERTIYLYLAAAFLVMFLGVRLYQGISESMQARGRKEHLQQAKKKIEDAQTEMLANAAQNAKAKARINRVLQEAELVPFQAFVLDFLAQQVKSEVKILGSKLVVEEGEDEPVYQFQIDGAADNASQKALERVETLRAAFAAEPRVGKVDVLSTRQVGNWYEFAMLLTPAFQAYR